MSPRLRWLGFFGLLAIALYLIVSPLISPNPAALDATPNAGSITTAIAPTRSPPTYAGGVYSEAIAGLPRAINPLFSDFNEADQDLVSLIFDGLTSNTISGEPRPALAESWDVSEDGLTYSFNLRRNVKWHDGSSFTANDVVSTIGLIQTPEFPGSPELADFWRRVTVQANGAYTIIFTLQEPYASFLSYTSLGILPARVIERTLPARWATHEFNQQPIGTGPFRLVKTEPARATLTLEPFADYYGQLPHLSRVELRFYRTEQAAIVAYQRGETLGVAHVTTEKLKDLRELATAQLFAAPMSGYNAIYFNLKNPVFQPTEVRQALLLALDRQALIDRAFDGQGVIAHSPLLPTNWAYNRFVKKYAPDLDAAKALLAQAGWKDTNGDGILDKGDLKLDFALMSSDVPEHIRVIEEVSRQWERLGVKARTQVTGFAGMARDFVRPRKYDTVYLEFRDPSTDPDLYALWHSTRSSDEGQNYASWNNRQADEVLEEARRIVDTKQRVALYHRFQNLFADDVPAILISYPVYVYAVDRRVQNVQLSPLTRPADRFRTIASWFVEQPKPMREATATPTGTK